MNLPEGMQSVNFNLCDGLTGTAESKRMSEVHIYSTRFGGPAARASSFLIFPFPLFAFPPAR